MARDDTYTNASLRFFVNIAFLQFYFVPCIQFVTQSYHWRGDCTGVQKRERKVPKRQLWVGTAKRRLEDERLRNTLEGFSFTYGKGACSSCRRIWIPHSEMRMHSVADLLTRPCWYSTVIIKQLKCVSIPSPYHPLLPPSALHHFLTALANVDVCPFAPHPATTTD